MEYPVAGWGLSCTTSLYQCALEVELMVWKAQPGVYALPELSGLRASLRLRFLGNGPGRRHCSSQYRSGVLWGWR